MAVVVDLTPVAVDLYGIRAGDGNAIPFYLHVGVDPVDLTGLTITSQARRSVTDSSALSATVELDPDPTTGKFVLSWDGEAVRELLAGKPSWSGVWDLQVGLDTLAAGRFTAAMDVTREG